MYKNIVFDFGGVMVDFDPYEYLVDLFGNHEVEDEVIDGPRSVVYDEAENRLHTAKAVMTLLMGGR